MPDDVAPTVAPPPPVAPSPTPVAVAAPAPPPPPPPARAEGELPAVGEQGWLKARLDAAKEGGVKEARKELKAERRAAKDAAREAKAVTEQATASVAAANRTLELVLADLPEDDRKRIKDAAGGDVHRALDLFAAHKIASRANPPAPAIAPLTVAPAVQPTPPAPAPAPAPPVNAAAAALAQQPPIAPPANTAGGGAPPPAAPASATPARETYETLRGTNPYLAAQFLLNNRGEIYPDRTINQVTAGNRR